MGTVPQVVLDELRDAYVDMMDKKARVAREVRERYRDKIAEEIERETRVLERAFGVQMVEVREMGATRKELVKVIGDGTSGVYRKFIELGGGSIAGRKTGADRLAERTEAINVERVAETLFEWTTDTGEVITLEICWLVDSPRVRGFDGENHTAFIEAINRDVDKAKELAAQIAATYSLTTDTGVQVS